MKAPPRTLTFVNGLAIVIGIQIGSGIFTSPSSVLSTIKSPLPAVLTWLIAGALAWTGASSFIELGSIMPRNGGIQEYLRYCYNDACACIATWVLIFIVKPCSIAMVSLIFAEYLLNAFASDMSAYPWLIKSIALLGFACISILNCIGTRVSARVANFFLVTKLLGLGSIIFAGFTLRMVKGKGVDDASGVNQLENIWGKQTRKYDDEQIYTELWANAGIYTDAILAAMWAYSGWESVSNYDRFSSLC